MPGSALAIQSNRVSGDAESDSRTTTARALLGLAALLLVIGTAMHTAGFRRADAVIAGSQLPLRIGNAFRALWLADSVTMLLVGVLFAAIAARPGWASRPVVILVALIHASVATLIYFFLGSFVGGHILAAASVGALIAGVMLPGKNAAR